MNKPATIAARCLSAAFLALCGEPVFAQPWLDFLKQPVLSEEDRRSMMYSYVDANLPPIELPSTRRAWEERKGPLRARILKLVGLERLDERAPVRWVAKGRIERDSYTIEKILFESYPGMMVSALVYVPKRIVSRAPAMVSIPGHVYCEGKGSESVQARCVNLALRGIIALTFDYLGTGERNTGADACGGMPYGGGNDHALRGFSYTAFNPTGVDILDGIRAVDYLLTRGDVDPERIGFTGESGGGNTTYWISALDERVALAAPVCSVTSFDYWIRNDRNWDWHQRPPGIRAVADISTLLALAAPRPLLVIGALRGTDAEEFPFDQTQEAVRIARQVYRLYGAEANLEIWESQTGHGYQRDKRERMYGFVEKRLSGRQNPDSKEAPFLLEPLPDLSCGAPPDNKTLAQLYAEWLGQATRAPALPDGRRAAEELSTNMREELTRLLGFQTGPAHARTTVQVTTSRGDVLIRRSTVETEPGIRLPLVEISPRASDAGGLVLMPGKSDMPPAAVAALLDAGLSVAVVDLRGAGEIYSGGGRTSNWAWFMGRPWPGMWAFDVTTLVETLSAERPARKVAVVARGSFSRAALFATALSERIHAAAVHLDTPTYRTEPASGELSDVPRILAHMDLPAISALAAPRPLYIDFPPSEEETFRQAYDWPRQFYRRGFNIDRLQLQPSSEAWWQPVSRWLAENLR
ncbi:MAG: prolyl oligopeptidase family serine peptidase [Bryobacteraceae bacterium]|nr:prolyl oligopeptidase family serine peptidase [Bryobacteraceae bacterium]